MNVSFMYTECLIYTLQVSIANDSCGSVLVVLEKSFGVVTVRFTLDQQQHSYLCCVQCNRQDCEHVTAVEEELVKEDAGEDLDHLWMACYGNIYKLVD